MGTEKAHWIESEVAIAIHRERKKKGNMQIHTQFAIVEKKNVYVIWLNQNEYMKLPTVQLQNLPLNDIGNDYRVAYQVMLNYP